MEALGKAFHATLKHQGNFFFVKYVSIKLRKKTRKRTEYMNS